MSKLLHKDHPLIRTKTKFFDFENPVIDPIELRNEMIQANWPAQRLSNIILKYEMKLQEKKSESQKLQDDLEPIND